MKVIFSYLLGRRSLLFFALLILVSSISFSQVCNLSSLPANLQNGLVAYYPFCGNANDASGNGNNGTVNGATLTTDRFGNTNNAYSFNGVNNYISVPPNTSNSSISNQSTIAGWSFSVDGSSYLVTKGNSTVLDYRILQNPNYAAFLINGVEYLFNTAFPINQWFHLVVTFSTVATLYVNGVSFSSVSTNAYPPRNSSTSLEIGRDVHNIAEYHSGKLDDIMVYNRALSQCEVLQLYNATANSIPLSSFLINRLSDTTRICGSSTTLNAGAGYSTYSWNTSATTQSISPTTSGFYKVTVTNSAGCSASDSTYLSLVNANILNNDTTICLGNSIRLSVDSLFPNRTACTKEQLPVAMRDGLIAYYPFCGNANNALGTGNNGTVYNATLTTDRFGNTNSAYNFNGTNAYIDFGSNTSIGPTSTIPISISLWVSGGASGNVISKYTNLDASRSFFLFGRSANGYSWIGNGTNPYINNSGVADNAWTHYVLVGVSGSNNSKVYRNGVLIATGTLAMNATMQAVSLLVGKVGASFPGFLNGKVDDIFIYNRALSLSEIQNLYLYQPTVAWSTGPTTNSIIVTPTQTTTYYVDVTDGINTCRDSVRVTVSDIGTFNPLTDTTRACGTSATLNAGSGYSSYLWNTGATTQSISPNTSGFYRVTVTNAAGCTAIDSTTLSLVNANILNNDTTICRGNGIQLFVDSTFSSSSSSRSITGGPVLLPSLIWNQANFSQFTINSKAKTTDFSTNSGTIYHQVNGGEFAFQIAGGNFIFKLKASYGICGTAGGWVNITHPIIDNLWHSYTGTYDRILGIAKLYIDGRLAVTSTINNGILASCTTYDNLISLQNTGVIIDDVFIHNYAWTPSEISALTCNSNITSSNGLVAYWNFEEGSGNIAYDLGPNSLNGTHTSTYVSGGYCGRNSVSWSTGATTNSITVTPTQTTTYYVTVSNGTTTCTDSVRVTVSDIGTFNPLSDTTRICGTSTVLNAGSGYSSYSWNTGSTSQSITVLSSGTYRVTVGNAAGCTASDSTYLSIVNANIINSDTTICKGSSVTLRIDSLFPGRTVCEANQLPSNLRNGLVGYWPFCGNANDASGNGNHGLVSGAALTSDRFRIPNRAYNFNGNSSQIKVNRSSSLEPANEISLSCWVLPQNPVYQPSDATQIVRKGESSGPGYHLTWSNLGNNRLESHYYTSGGSLVHGVSNLTYMNDWHHLVMTYSRTNGISNLFIDGILVSSQACSNQLNHSDDLYIGGFRNYQFFTGKIDDLMIWNRALSATEIQQIYTSVQSVTWSTGATTNSITVSPTQTTTYYVTVSDGISSCIDSVRITVADVDTSVVVLDPAQVCSNSGQVRMQAGQASTYQWLRNGVAIVGATARLYTATQTGTYRVALTNSLGCKDTSRAITISLYAQPISGFNTSPQTQCFNGNEFVFANSTTITTGTVSYLWNFGNGITSTLSAPIYTYPSSGTYIVKLVATSNNGCKDSTIRTLTVNPSPAAVFTVNNANQCITGNSFTFTNNSSISSGALTYLWSFGDGNTSTNANASHAYINSGTYTVKLVVTSALGCKDSTTRSVTVFEKPQVSFSINNASQCVNGNSFVFTNNTTISAGTVSYIWTFGDGGSANTTNATYSYTTPGTYVVKLVATSNNGCADSTTQTVTVNPKPTVNFSINAANQCLTGNQYIFTNQSSVSAGTLTHLWSFGDGNISIQPSTTYTYSAHGTYTVKLVSTSALGCRDSVSRSITVYPMPTGVLATPSTNLLCEGGSVQLSATGGATYQWFLNGGAIAGATNSTHAATQPGVYTVNLISSNNCTAQASGSISLQLVQKPTANFSYDKYCAGFPTQFNDQSNTTNSNVVTYNWSFGTGQGTSTLQNPTYTFPTASVYSVSLVVTPVACPSLAASITKSVTTVAAPANQRYTSLNAVENRNLQLDARTFGGASYNWSPATGLNSATISNPIFNYNREVDYVITITTGIGCVIKDTQLVRIFKEKEIYVPKGFSPNGDGNNDKIFPRLVGVRTLTYFKVYNRWGQLLYQTSNINEGWDGTFRGTKQPIETYVWIAEGVDIDNNSIKRTGTFLLLR